MLAKMEREFWAWVDRRREAKAERERLCAHDGSDPMCDDCAFAYNPPP